MPLVLDSSCEWEDLFRSRVEELAFLQICTAVAGLLRSSTIWGFLREKGAFYCPGEVVFQRHRFETGFLNGPRV